MSSVQKNVPVSTLETFDPSDLLSIEEVARRLRTDVAWVREKCRRRCSSPIPVHNLGRHLLFYWPDVCEWIRSTPRPVHAAHRPRTKSEVEKAKAARAVKKTAKAAA